MILDEAPCARCGAPAQALLVQPPLHLCDSCATDLVHRLADQDPALQFSLEGQVGMQRARLDELWKAAYSIATDDALPSDVRLEAIHEGLVVMDQQANLYGLYAQDETAAEMRRLTSELEQRERDDDGDDEVDL